MAASPTVLYPLTLPALLNHILSTRDKNYPATLIICSSRDDFLQDLVHSMDIENGRDAATLQQSIIPTLRNLSAATSVDLVFCASVQALLAHLSTCTPPHNQDGESQRRTIVLVNPIALHAPTSSFSAQGLSRTFAAAVEAALRIEARLVVAETEESLPRPPPIDEDMEDAMEATNEPHVCEKGKDPWEQEVPILSVSAARFATGAGERPWAGRVVKVNRVAARWFRFCKIMDEGAWGTI